MNTPALTIYDDGRGRFGPMAKLRAAFEFRTGVSLSFERIEKVLNRSAGIVFVPDMISGVVAERHPGVRVNPNTLGKGACVFVNGRWAGIGFTDEVRGLSPGQAVVQGDGQVVAACLDHGQAQAFVRSGFVILPDKTSTIRLTQRALIERPWHVLDELPINLLVDLSSSDTPMYRAEDHPGVTTFGEHPIRIGSAAQVMPSVVIDAAYGPVVIEAGAVVNPLTVLQGPCSVGRDSVLVSHTSIRRYTVVGPCCKVGGEIAGSILHSYTNKAHAGYLGDSLVGSWVNLGADTNVSNLKNTYNPVRVRLDEDAPEEDTGRTFQGAIIGDYVRTAIGTRLSTGTVVHPGCMLAVTGWAPKLATALGFYTDAGRQDYDPDKLIATLQAVMDRREVKMGQQIESLIRSLK